MKSREIPRRWMMVIAFSILLISVSPMKAATRGDPLEGRKIYLTFCFACHGDTGKGNGPAAPLLPVPPTDHTRNEYMARKTDRDLFKAISGGGAFHGSRYMPSWNKRFLEEEIWDLVAYLRYLHRPSMQGSAKRGKSLYTRYCTVCHGETGRGDGPMAEVLGKLGPTPLDFTNKELMTTRSDSELFLAIFGGGKSGGKSDYMPRWGGTLSEKEMWDLVAYLRSLAQK